MASSAIKSTLTMITPCLAMFLFMFSEMVQYPVIEIMILKKTCNRYLPREVCRDLSLARQEDEMKLRLYTKNYMSSLETIGTITSAILTVVLATQSDRKGRRRVLVVPCIGVAIYAIIMFIQTKLRFLSPILMYGSNLAVGLTGGRSTFLTVMMCYITDKSPAEGRAKSLSTLIGAMALGTTIGNISTRMVSGMFGTSQIFLVILACQIVSITLILVFIQEETEAKDTELAEEGPKGRCSFLKSIWSNLTAGPRLVLGSHEGSRRTNLILMILVSIFGMACSTADSSLLGLQVQRPPLNWSSALFKSFNNAKSFMSLLGTLIIIRLYLRFTTTSTAVAELNLMLVAETCNLFSVMALIISPFALTFVPLFALFTGPLLPVSRSYLTGIVEPSETGALFGFINLLNTMAIPIGSTAVMIVYGISKGSATWISFLVIFIVKVFALWLIWILRRRAGGGVKKGL